MPAHFGFLNRLAKDHAILQDVRGEPDFATVCCLIFLRTELHFQLWSGEKWAAEVAISSSGRYAAVPTGDS